MCIRDSYKEDSPPLNEDEDLLSPSPPPASKKGGKGKKVIALDDEDDAAAAADEDALPMSGEDDLFDETDELRAASAKLDKRMFLPGKVTARAQVSTKQRKKQAAKQRKKQRRGSDDDDASSSDSEADREEERQFDKEKGLIYSDAEESSDDGGVDSAPSDENPIDLLLGSRVIQIPAEPGNPDKAHMLLTRVEFYVKYKSLAYMHADWVDKKTIESWKVSAARQM